MRPGVLLLAVILVTGFLQPALAQKKRAPGVQPLDRILSEVRRTHPGQFYDADGPTPGPGGSEHYHLKWMTPDGRIEWLDTDARTGRVLGSSPDRNAFAPSGPGRGPAPPPPSRSPRFAPGGYGGYQGPGRGATSRYEGR